MTSTSFAPGLKVTIAPRPEEPTPLRTDVAGFMGRTRRGPLNRAVRVDGWRSFLEKFGGLEPDRDTPYAVKGYFENGGEVAWIRRLGSETPAAVANLTVGGLDATGAWAPDTPAGFTAVEFTIVASSPGAWGNGLEVSIRYLRHGLDGTAEVDAVVTCPDEAPEYLTGLPARDWHSQVNERSRLIRVEAGAAVEARDSGPRARVFQVTLSNGVEPTVVRVDYMAGIDAYSQEPEIALLLLPDLHGDLPESDQRRDVITTALAQADELHDRMVLLDMPPESVDVTAAMAFTAALRGGELGNRLRAGAVYFPRLVIPDPAGGALNPLRTIGPSGHTAGVMSRLDRLRGAHETPANVGVDQVVDVAAAFDEAERGVLNAAGVNLLRCFPGRGIQIWGGRTAAVESTSMFIAHRRLIHRLVRGIRRVSEPLVFEVNGPELWLTLVRGVTTILLEAWRAGSLRGARPEEAFRVTCDASTNPPEQIVLGQLVFLVELAPAVPMEFIQLRIAMSADAQLEIFES